MSYPGAMESKFTFIDLFAGIGGMRIPFDELGGACLLTSEIDPSARLTYSVNFGHKNPNSHRLDTDITKLSGDSVPGHDLLLAGFPCQPFSHAGHRLGFEDMRGTLFFDIMRLLETLNARSKEASLAPKVIILENVKGLKSHDKGRTLSRIREELEKLYFITEVVLDARNFGLPQSRLRLFLIGIRRDIEGAETFQDNFLESIALKTTSSMPTKVSSILESPVDERYRISDRIWDSHRARKLKHLEKGNGWGYRLVTPNSSHTATLSARYYKDGSEILIEDKVGQNPRKLTPPEAAALQGFPKEFQIPVSDTQAYRQFGNAVPVTVVRFIATAVIKYLT